VAPVVLPVTTIFVSSILSPSRLLYDLVLKVNDLPIKLTLSFFSILTPN